MERAHLRVLTGAFGANAVYTAAQPHPSPPQCSVVLFPGDRIQAAGMPDLVARLQDPHHLAALLLAKFTAPHVFIVMPSRYEAGFACYDHFLTAADLSGRPLAYRGAPLRASQQLSSLLRGAGWEPRRPCHLVGFSKGGVVVNQLLAEVAAVSRLQGAGALLASPGAALEGACALLCSLRQVHFVDAGEHLTDPEVTQGLGAWCQRRPSASLRIFLHGTPRQWDDPHRPWICIQKNRFKEMCRAGGVPIQELKYCEGQQGASERRRLEQHFACLRDFAVQPSSES